MSKSIKEIKQEAANKTWEELVLEGYKNREQFLEIFPEMKDWLDEHEAVHGKFIGINSLQFTDERCVFLTKWEKTYTVDFHNPNNPEGEQETVVNLSYEAMNGFLTLFRVFKGDEELRRFWLALGLSKESVEEYIEDLKKHKEGANFSKNNDEARGESPQSA